MSNSLSETFDQGKFLKNALVKHPLIIISLAHAELDKRFYHLGRPSKSGGPSDSNSPLVVMSAMLTQLQNVSIFALLFDVLNALSVARAALF